MNRYYDLNEAELARDAEIDPHKYEEAPRDLLAELLTAQRTSAANADLALKLMGKLALIAEIVHSVPDDASHGFYWKRVQDLASGNTGKPE